MATSATEGRRVGEAILSEAPGGVSRDQVTVVSGQNLPNNAVVGKITATGKIAKYDNGASDGTEVAYGVLLAAVDATGGDAPGTLLERVAELKADLLDWNTQDSTAQTAGIADLLARNIRRR